MFRPIIQELLNIEKIVIENSIKSKLEMSRTFWVCPWYCWKTFDE
jgi:hypothetical protein